MRGQERILAFIPARGGSKGIPHKNIRELNGKPLIAWTIEAANKSNYIDYVFVSTDDDQIADVAIEYGANVPFFRPEELAGDKSKTIDCVVDALIRLKRIDEMFDCIVLLQPTSPLRNEEHIDEAVEIYYKYSKKGVVSVNPVENNPVLIRSIGNDGILRNLLGESSTVRRQEMKEYYVVNGAVYINAVSDISLNHSFNDNPIPYIMESKESVDIDTELDFDIAEMIMKAEKVY